LVEVDAKYYVISSTLGEESGRVEQFLRTCFSGASGRCASRPIRRLMAKTSLPPTAHQEDRLSRIMPRIENRLRYLDHIESRRVHLFRVACEHSLEEVEAGERSNLSDRCTTSWAKMKNPSDSGNGSF